MEKYVRRQFLLGLSFVTATAACVGDEPQLFDGDAGVSSDAASGDDGVMADAGATSGDAGVPADGDATASPTDSGATPDAPASGGDAESRDGDADSPDAGPCPGGDHERNVCNGCGAVTAINGASPTGKPGDACGSCNSGQTFCADSNTLSCIGATTNACGGCGTLAGAPNTACGTCSGTWTCSADKSSVTCTGDHAANACGGCSTLSPAFGTACSRGLGSCTTSGKYACSGNNATTCDAPAPPAPSSWATTPWNGSWDRNCDGHVDQNPSGFIPYDPVNFPNDGPHWAQSASKICADGYGTCNRGINGGTVSQWLYYPASTAATCGQNYIQFRCTLKSGNCVYAESYCNDPNFDDLSANCTIRNNVLLQCQ